MMKMEREKLKLSGEMGDISRTREMRMIPMFMRSSISSWWEGNWIWRFDKMKHDWMIELTEISNYMKMQESKNYLIEYHFQFHD